MFILALSVNVDSFAQSHELEEAIRYYHAHQFDHKAGLDSDQILAVAEDDRSLIWLVTNEALYRFDGIVFDRIQSLLPSYRRGLIFVPPSTILVADRHKLMTVDTRSLATETHPLQCPDRNKECEVHKLVTKDNTIWINSGQGLLKYREANFSEAPQLVPLTQKREVHDFVLLDSGQLLVATVEGLLYNEPKTRGDKLAQLTKAAGRQATSLCYSAADPDTIYIGTGNGLFTLSAQSLQWQQVNKKISYVSNILCHHSGDVWVESLSQGLWRKPANTRKFHQAAFGNQSILANRPRFTSLHADSRNNLWLGSFTRGLFQLSPQAQHIWQSLNTSEHKKQFAENPIYSMTLYNDHLWLGHGTHGLTHIHRQTGQSTVLNSTNSQLPNNGVWHFTEDEDGSLWIGTYRGVAEYDPDSQKITRRFEAFINEPIVFILSAKAQHLWLGGVNKLFYCHRKKESCQVYRPGDDNIASKFYLSIVELGNTLYIASSTGILTFDPATQHFDQIVLANKKTFHAVQIVEHEGGLWVAGDQGLIYYEPDTQNTRILTRAHGLLSDNIKALAVHQNRLTISTSHGVNHLDLASGAITALTQEHGLTSNNFLPKSLMFDEQDNLLLGSLGGLTTVQPEAYQTIPAPPLELMDVRVNGQSIPMPTDPRSLPSDHSLPDTHAVINMPFDGQLRLRLRALDYSHGQHKQFMYRHSGGEWQQAEMDSKQWMILSGLPSGQYTLAVRAVSSLDQWQTPVMHLTINKATPWWEWPLVWGLTLVMLLLSSIGLGQWRSRRIIVKNRRLEATVKERTTKISDLLNQREAFFSHVAHELKTPIALIQGPLDFIARQTPDEKSQQVYRLGRLNSAKLLRLVEQLLEMDKYLLKQKTKQSVLKLSEWCSVVTESFSLLATQRDIHFNVTIEPNLLVWGSSDALDKVISNLLSNAFKYTPVGGSVDIHLDACTHQQKPCVQMMISDNGPGIPAHERNKVFERFYRLDRDGNSSGSGIGLAMVKQLVEQHDGHINITDSVHGGACVTVLWPQCKPGQREATLEPSKQDHAAIWSERESQIIQQEWSIEHSSHNDSHSQPDQSSKPQRKVLLIDDNPSVIEFLSLCFSEQYQVLSAPDGQQGLTIAKTAQPDLVISDVMMPVMNGIDLCEQLKLGHDTAHIPIVIVSAKTRLSDKLSAFEMLADAYFNKPFVVDELMATVKSLINNRVALKRKLNIDASLGIKNTDTNHALSAKEQKFIQTVNETIEAHYQEESLNANFLAEKCFTSRSNLDRQVKALFATTTAELIKSYRLEKARSLINADTPIGYIAEETGFQSQSYFAKCFSARFGCSPTDYKKQSTEFKAESKGSQDQKP